MDRDHRSSTAHEVHDLRLDIRDSGDDMKSAGLEATKQIRREEAMGTHIPIVAMTASAMSEDRDHCLAAGMDNFISKPVSSKVIEEIITATFSRLS